MMVNTKKPRATLTISKGCTDTNLSAHPFERYLNSAALFLVRYFYILQ